MHAAIMIVPLCIGFYQIISHNLVWQTAATNTLCLSAPHTLHFQQDDDMKKCYPDPVRPDK
jgi:hypothetical protein